MDIEGAGRPHCFSKRHSLKMGSIF